MEKVRGTFARLSSGEGWRDGLAGVSAGPLPNLATLALIVALSWQLAVLTWELLPGGPPVAAPVGVNHSASSRSVQQGRAEDLQQLTQLHLFGQPAVEPQARAAPERAPETTLKLTLYGVFTYTPPSEGAAIIGRSGGEQSFFRVGDQVFGGARLEEVRADHVILFRNGRYETLRFPKEPQLDMAVTQDRETSAGPSSTVDVSQFRQAVGRSPERLLDYIRVHPVQVGNQVTGYRVLPGNDRSLYTKLGLHPSDVVVSVNGVSLRTLDSPAKLMEQLTDSERIDLEILRQGSYQTLTLNLR